MSIAQPWPFYPDFQNCSGTFNASGTVTVNTKFRRVDSYIVQEILTGLNASMQGAVASGYLIQTSKNAGQITASLQNVSTQISSAISLYVWATGIQ